MWWVKPNDLMDWPSRCSEANGWSQQQPWFLFYIKTIRLKGQLVMAYSLTEAPSFTCPDCKGVGVYGCGNKKRFKAKSTQKVT